MFARTRIVCAIKRAGLNTQLAVLLTKLFPRGARGVSRACINFPQRCVANAKADSFACAYNNVIFF